jgi:ATP-dependent DNA helicase RecQ
MRVKVITLRYSPSLGGFDERPLSDFVRDKEVLAVREHFFCVHDLPHLACLITYQASTVSAPAHPAHGTKRAGNGRSNGRLDALLADPSEADRILFGTLREWRVARARKDGVPPYVVFTNRELLSIVKAKPETRSALGSLDGIGAGNRVNRGGSWTNTARNAGSANRNNNDPTNRNNNIGFRPASSSHGQIDGVRLAPPGDVAAAQVTDRPLVLAAASRRGGTPCASRGS